MIQLRLPLLAVLALLPFTQFARAEAPQVTSASIAQQGDGWTVRAVIRHPDTGWDHYASGWQVLAPDGQVLAFAEITHPHPGGEPIKEELTGITLPQGVDHLMIRVRCTLDGWSARVYRLDVATQIGSAP